MSNSPLSPEILIPNLKYTIQLKDGKYVGYFFKLAYCCGTCYCVFTSRRNGDGSIIVSAAPTHIRDFSFTPNAKVGKNV